MLEQNRFRQRVEKKPGTDIPRQKVESRQKLLQAAQPAIEAARTNPTQSDRKINLWGIQLPSSKTHFKQNSAHDIPNAPAIVFPSISFHSGVSNKEYSDEKLSLEGKMTMEPNAQHIPYHRQPPPKDVDPPRQRIDVAVSSHKPLDILMCANIMDSVNVVGDGKSNVPDGVKINRVVKGVSRRTTPANLSIVFPRSSFRRMCLILHREQSHRRVMLDPGVLSHRHTGRVHVCMGQHTGV